MGLCPFFFIKFKMLNNRIDSTEIIKIADAVLDEKSIDKNLVLNSMETAIEKAARTRYGSENEIYVKIDRETGKIELGRKLKVVEKGSWFSHSEIDLNEAKKINSEYKIGDVMRGRIATNRFWKNCSSNCKASNFCSNKRCGER